MRAIWLACLLALGADASELKMAPEYAVPDGRYKADILVVVAHPDDETMIASYLARATLDEHRRIAAIFTTRGEIGGSAVGNERGNALGFEREIEARRGLASLGVTNVWFLNAPNTPSQNVVRALEYWDHGSILAQVVRLVRLTRPEVIITWLPVFVVGENHADHQASSIVANEAFDLAGDSSAFSEQLGTAQRDALRGHGHNPEGLSPWQPKKIYYFSDATDMPTYWWRLPPEPSPFRKNFLDGAGPTYSSTDVSPAKRVSYAWLGAKETSFHLSQDGIVAETALQQGDLKAFEHPNQFVLGKSLVGGSSTGDIFERITHEPMPYVRPPEATAQTRRGVSLEVGGPWEFYRGFWKAHALERLSKLLPIPEVGTGPGMGHNIDIPLVIRNDTDTRQNVTLKSTLPNGWAEQARYSTFPLGPYSIYPVDSVLSVPATAQPGWYAATWTAEAGGRQIASVAWRVYVFVDKPIIQHHASPASAAAH